MKLIRTTIAVALAMLAFTGFAGADTTDPASEPEPAMCLGVQPLCIGGGYACCRCEIGGINCVWACCK